MIEKKDGLKEYFIAGLFSLLPLVFTVWVARYLAHFAWNSFFSLFVPLVDRAMTAIGEPTMVGTWQDEFIGFVLLLFFVLGVGFVAKRFVGSGLLKLVDKMVGAIPGVNWIYGTIRQLADTMDPASPQHDAFRKPVLVKMEHGYVMGFLTSRSELKGRTFATVFFPCNQLIQGYNLLVEESRCMALDMNVDAAIKYVVSFGMMAPPVFKSAALKKKK
jgi:uncharacterized membrane protein